MASAAPIRAIVGRFGMDFARQVMENVLNERPFDFCGIISVGVEPKFFRGMPADNQEWFASSMIRGCEYAGVDWQTLAPIDEALIMAMRECEATFMEMVSRLEWKRSISYGVRKRWYLRHLRFWNDYLTRHRIGLYLSAWVPHEIPDIIIYALCKLRNIPVVYFGVTSIRDVSFVEHDWEESAVQVRDRYRELLLQYGPDHDPLTIPLEERLDLRYRGLVNPSGEVPTLEEQDLDLSHGAAVKRLLKTDPVAFLRHGLAYATPRGAARAYRAWKRNKSMTEANAFYDTHASDAPDLRRSYVYMPLSFQPEATTVPLAGGYADQVLMAQMLSALLPQEVMIYVKEHPRPSSSEKRTVDFYRDFAAISRVRFIPRSFDTFAMREHCRAIATTAGTAGFEASFRGKPVFMFGHCYYQYAPGVHRIHSMDDCRNAVREIFDGGAAPTLLQCRLYLKAIEETCVHGVLDPWCFNVSHLSADENMKNSSAAIVQELDALFGSSQKSHDLANVSSD
ncbi:hypothetical protein HYW84_02290 [Candidatus Peregrinibacteria bacterium]|nr:hypothetical protein [Candidatus Peregrinibacteria bacterium]